MQTVTTSSAQAQGIETARDQAMMKTRESLTAAVVLSGRDGRRMMLFPRDGNSVPQRGGVAPRPS